MATRWTRIAAIAAAGCLIAGAALAQQNIDPPNKRPRKGEAGPESRGNDASDALGKPGSTD